jgi:hypothetical protein
LARPVGHSLSQLDQLGQAGWQRLRAELEPVLSAHPQALEQQRHQAAVPSSETGGVKRQRRNAAARQFLLNRTQPGNAGLCHPVPGYPD